MNLVIIKQLDKLKGYSITRCVECDPLNAVMSFNAQYKLCVGKPKDYQEVFMMYQDSIRMMYECIDCRAEYDKKYGEGE